MKDCKSTVEQGQRDMLLAALRILRKAPDSLQTQVDAFHAADAAGSEFTQNRKGRQQLERDLAEYLNRELINQALDILTDAEDGKNYALEIMASLEEGENLEVYFPPEKLEAGFLEMKIAAQSIFKQKGKHARSMASTAAGTACQEFANGNEMLETILRTKIPSAVKAALDDYKLDVKVKASRRERLQS